MSQGWSEEDFWREATRDNRFARMGGSAKSRTSKQRLRDWWRHQAYRLHQVARAWRDPSGWGERDTL